MAPKKQPADRQAKYDHALYSLLTGKAISIEDLVSWGVKVPGRSKLSWIRGLTGGRKSSGRRNSAAASPRWPCRDRSKPSGEVERGQPPEQPLAFGADLVRDGSALGEHVRGSVGPVDLAHRPCAQ